jgi:hypothetical protein
VNPLSALLIGSIALLVAGIGLAVWGCRQLDPYRGEVS